MKPVSVRKKFGPAHAFQFDDERKGGAAVLFRRRQKFLFPTSFFKMRKNNR